MAIDGYRPVTDGAIHDLIRIHQQTLRRKDNRLTPYMVGKAHDIIAALESFRYGARWTGFRLRERFRSLKTSISHSAPSTEGCRGGNEGT